MSTESEDVNLSSKAVDGSNATRMELENDQMSEKLVDSLSGQDQELETNRKGKEQEGCITVEPGSGSLALAGDIEMEKVNGFTDLEKQTESVHDGLDLGNGTQIVDVETNKSEKKDTEDSEEVMTGDGENMLCEKSSDAIQTEPLVEKEMEPDMVSSHAPNLSDVKGSDIRLDSEDLGEDSKPNGSAKQGTTVENSSDDSSDESSSDDDNSLVNAKLNLSDSDLVWAKVRSHPWWPGQVFDASAATDKAKKYFKKGSFLVTYFGDCSFAWNDASRIKPFRENFSEMAKQSSLPNFIDAIGFALEEVSRRIEFGLACSCISEEIYQEIKTQNIINPGLLEDSSRIHGGDKISSALFFEPESLVEYMKDLACSTNYDVTDELKFVSHRAQLLAFNRWKGFSDLPEFEILQGSVESAPNISTTEEKSSLYKAKVSVPEPEKTKLIYTKRRKTENQDESKNVGVFEYEDNTVLKKKEKTLAEFIAEKRLSRSKGKKSQEKSVTKPDCEKKRKVVYTKVPKSTKKIKANLQTEDTGSPVSSKSNLKSNLTAGDKITPEKGRSSFGIGASILRVANQMHCSTQTGVLPCSNSTSKTEAKNKGSGKSVKGTPRVKSSPQSASATKTPNRKRDHLQSGELEEVIKETPCTNPLEDSILETSDLEDSSKEQLVHEDKKEAANLVGEITVDDSNLTEDVTDPNLKEQYGNKNGSDESVHCKEDSSTE